MSAATCNLTPKVCILKKLLPLHAAAYYRSTNSILSGRVQFCCCIGYTGLCLTFVPLFFHVSSFIYGSGNRTWGDSRHGELSNDPVQLCPSRKVLCKKLGHRKKEKCADNNHFVAQHHGVWFGVSLLLAPQLAPVGCMLASSVAGPSRPSVVPSSYAIIFGPRPVSTWEQCKLFKTRFQAPQL